MKNIFLFSMLAALITLPVAASAGEKHHDKHAKLDCAAKENAGKPECEKHDAAAPAAAAPAAGH